MSSPAGVRPRPRGGRITAFLAAAATTVVSLVGAMSADGREGRTARSAGAAVSLTGGSPDSPPDSPLDSPPDGPQGGPSDSAAAPALATASSTALRAALSVGLPALGAAPRAPRTDEGLADRPPGDSGTGRRVVFSESQQRVWLVDADEEVTRTYLVSGSVFDNLDPGFYAVYSRSRSATGVDGSALRYMVRFTHGDSAAIGFHSIPRLDGRRLQTRAQLGTPLSHGCVRQALPDARALWRFAPVGTAVVVTP